jgi:hypothetical protein
MRRVVKCQLVWRRAVKFLQPELEVALTRVQILAPIPSGNDELYRVSRIEPGSSIFWFASPDSSTSA